MTNEDVSNGFTEVYNGFWLKYRDRQPNEQSEEWERMHTRAALLRRKYPLLEETVNRMLTEIIERSRGRGYKVNDFHHPPRGEA